MVWERKSTKEERRKDRAAVGNLMDLLLSPRRAVRNRKAADIFVHWARQAGYPLNHKNTVLVAALCERKASADTANDDCSAELMTL